MSGIHVPLPTSKSYITEMRLRLYDDLVHCNWNIGVQKSVVAHQCSEVALVFEFSGAVDADDSLDFVMHRLL